MKCYNKMQAMKILSKYEALEEYSFNFENDAITISDEEQDDIILIIWLNSVEPTMSVYDTLADLNIQDLEMFTKLLKELNTIIIKES